MKRSHPAVLFALCAALPVVSFAQSWVASKGATDVSLTYQFSNFLGHLGPDGAKHPENGSRSQAVTLEVDHSLTDRLAMSVSLPYIATKFSDPAPGVDRSGINDGHYHATWQDYHLDVRYNALRRPVVFTPFLALVVPSHHYETIGEVAVGRDLRELHLGFNVGRLLDPWLPNAYFDVHAGYAFSQKALGVSTNKTFADLSAGYFITPRLSGRIIANLQKTHGGLACGQCVGGDIPPDVSLGHDRLLRDNHFRAGLGVDFAVTPATGIYAAYVNTVRGSSTHYGYGVSAGVSRTFSP